MKKISLVLIGALSIQPAFSDNLKSIPETHSERWHIAYFCNATLAASLTDAQLQAVGEWIAKYKPDIDCQKEQTPSLVNPDSDKKK